jgi:hypothetical protein
MLSGCAAEKPRLASVNTNPSPYASGKIHTEPLYYNGKTYQVRMQHRVSDGVFLVNVSAPGRRLGTTPAMARSYPRWAATRSTILPVRIPSAPVFNRAAPGLRQIRAGTCG